jgi:predicted N-acetyltransferase YhbS
MAGVYEVQKPSTPGDLEQVYGLMRAVFPNERVDELIGRLLDHYPETSLDHVFTVRRGGETVAALMIIPQTWVLGGVELKVAEMGCVATRPDHRRRGLQRTLNQAFDAYAAQHGFDICALAGIPFFYRQFGYEYAVELDHWTALEAERIPVYDPSLEARPFTEGDLDAASEMLEAAQSRYLVSSPRTRAVWLMQYRTGRYNGEPFEGVALTAGGDLKAYVRLSVDSPGGALVLREAGLASPAYAEPVLAYLKAACRERGLAKVRSQQSYGDEPTRTMVGLGGVTAAPYAWQVKVVDHLRLFRKLVPLLESRLRGSGYGGLTETMSLNFRRFSVVLTVERGRIKGVELSDDCRDRAVGLNPYVFPQLLLGHRSLRELEAAYPDVRVRDTHRPILEAMFPRGPGYVHHVY